MRIEHENPENELHAERASEMLTVVALIYHETGGKDGAGSIECPTCRTGRISYSITRTHTRRAAIAAKCSTSGCIRFMS